MNTSEGNFWQALFNFIWGKVTALIIRLIKPIRGRKGKRPTQPAVGKAPEERSLTEILEELVEAMQKTPEEESDSYHKRANMCLILELRFQQLQHSRDPDEIAEILAHMRKTPFNQALRAFPYNYPGLGGMLNSVCHCFSLLYDAEEELKKLTEENFKRICENGVEVCRVLLLCFARRDKRVSLPEDAAPAVAESIGMLDSTLVQYSSNWPEDLRGDFLNRILESVVSVLKSREDFSYRSIREKLQQIASRTNDCLVTLAEEEREKWLDTLGHLFCQRPPQNLSAQLFRLWKRLLFFGYDDAFTFLHNLIERTFQSTLDHMSKEPEAASIETDVEVRVIECVRSLSQQCCDYCRKLVDTGRIDPKRFGNYWCDSILPLVREYKLNRESRLGPLPQRVDSCLEGVISTIENLLGHIKNAPPVSVKAISAPRKVTDPSDTIFV